MKTPKRIVLLMLNCAFAAFQLWWLSAISDRVNLFGSNLWLVGILPIAILFVATAQFWLGRNGRNGYVVIYGLLTAIALYVMVLVSTENGKFEFERIQVPAVFATMSITMLIINWMGHRSTRSP